MKKRVSDTRLKEILLTLRKIRISGRARQLLDAILCECFSEGQDWPILSLEELSQATGIPKKNLPRERLKLAQMGILDFQDVESDPAEDGMDRKMYIVVFNFEPTASSILSRQFSQLPPRVLYNNNIYNIYNNKKNNSFLKKNGNEMGIVKGKRKGLTNASSILSRVSVQNNAEKETLRQKTLEANNFEFSFMDGMKKSKNPLFFEALKLSDFFFEKVRIFFPESSIFTNQRRHGQIKRYLQEAIIKLINDDGRTPKQIKEVIENSFKENVDNFYKNIITLRPSSLYRHFDALFLKKVNRERERSIKNENKYDFKELIK